MQKQLSTPKSSSSRTSRRYEQPTIASKSRSPSPYTNRRMCELSEDSRQRLAHLNLGPYEFKKETCSKPPFVVRHVETSSSPDTTALSCSADESSRLHTDTSILDSLRPRGSRDLRRMHIDDLQMSLDNVNNKRLQESPLRTTSALSRSAPPSVLRHPPSPVLSRSSLRERFWSDHRASANWKETHERVKSILRTHSVQQKLHSDKNVSWKESDYSNTVDDEVLGARELQDSLSFPQDKSVHLDNGEFWCNRAAAYKGKSHRIIFEESMEKIYKNMYRNAVNPNAYRKSHHSKEFI
ncbi:spermatogenesis-associated protein 6 [Bufo bufo]|uniref:spermatogenesis-associated protein 6 n=1 Tax=Bufo bufo TaxID=8384 RepID=UPI001ABDFE99|nr:spermatogenesis-associated protein 6 [Bufo bufo]XP_040263956.1 spermatogenesis-associated protein 6 [Bufo bufo]